MNNDTYYICVFLHVRPCVRTSGVGLGETHTLVYNMLYTLDSCVFVCRFDLPAHFISVLK